MAHRTSKDPEERRQEFLDAAEHLFLTKGYENTSIGDIVKAVGVAHGLFYYYFTSKDDILDGIISRNLSHFEKRLANVVDDGGSTALEKMAGMFSASFDFKKGRTGFLTYVNTKEQHVLCHSSLRRGIFENILPYFTRIIEQGNDEGVFDVSYPTETGYVIFSLSGLFDVEAERFDVAALKQRFFALIDIMEHLLGTKKGTLLSIFAGAIDNLDALLAETVDQYMLQKEDRDDEVHTNE